MAFEGDLTNLGLADIFQTLGMNRQSGTLVVKVGETERRFYFSDDGVSLLTSRSARKFRLGNLLVGMGKLAEGDLKVAVLKQERAKETKLGDILLQTGLVKAEDISDACKYQAAEEIYESFNWKSGKFQFLEGANAGPSGGPGPFAEFFFSVTDVVMEAARRSDEYGLALQKIGEQEEFYARRSEDPLPEDKYDRPTRLLYQMLDGSLDVAQAFDEFYLSPFDTALSMAKLIENGLVITMDASSLEAASRPFLEKKDYARASRLLARAAKLDPANAGLLSSLAEAQSAAGDRKVASKTYAALGSALKAQEHKTEAVEALRKAVEHDSHNEGAHELLMEVQASLDQFAKAEESCREASRLLAEDRDFHGSLRVLDKGLALVPESHSLRRQRANCLIAMGQREDGLKEILAVAADMEAAKADRKEILEVYRKLAQLEPDNKDYKERIQDLLAGEKARETRKKVLRAAGVLGVVAVAVAGWMMIKTTAQKIEETEAVIRGPAGPGWDEAEAFLQGVRAGESADSELGKRADALLRELADRRSSPEREKRIKELEGRLRTAIIDPAMALVKAGDFEGGVVRILDILPEITNQSLADVKGDDLDKMWTRLQKAYMAVLQVPAGALRDQAKIVKDAKDDVGNTDVTKVEAARVREILAIADHALQGRERTDWTAVVAVLKKVSDGKLMGVETLRMPELFLALQDMQSGYGTLEDLRHRARAEVFRDEMQALYSATLAAVSESKNSGRLAVGIEACDAFLKRCAELKVQEPKKYFAPVADRLLRDLRLEGDVTGMRTLLKGISDSLLRAEAEEKRGNYQASFDILKKTISAAQDVSFRGRALLPLRVVTRPAGAKLDLTADLGEGTGTSTVSFTTPCTVHYPYQGKSIIELSMPGFDAAVMERTGIEGDRVAEVSVDLQRSHLWTTTAGAAVEGRPGLSGGMVLVGTRGGLFRALEASSGNLLFQVDTGSLSGISGGILVSGGRAYFGGKDGEAFAVDLAAKAVAWKTPIGTALERAPVLSGGLVIFGDSDGKVHALESGGGVEKWAKPLGSPVSGRLLALDGLVLVPLADQRVVALSASDGAEKWSASLKGPVFGTMVADGRGGVLAGTESSTVERIALADGKVTWSAEVDGPVGARPVLRGDGVLAVTARGTLVTFAAADGGRRGTTSFGHAVEGGVHVMGETLYVSGAGGVLLAFDLAKNEVIWTRSELGRLLTEPVGDGSILVTASGDNAGLVVGLKP